MIKIKDYVYQTEANALMQLGSYYSKNQSTIKT